MPLNNERLVMQRKSCFTLSEYPQSVYGEKVARRKGEYLRYWDPRRSKLAAAILNGLEDIPFSSGSNVLYLGASTGTTVSHVSDLCSEGRIFAVESSYESFAKLLKLAEARKNIYPVLEDANHVERYAFFPDSIDTIYQDISQRNQAQIFNLNAERFNTARDGIFVLKTRAISSRTPEKQILSDSLSQITSFKVRDVINLKPYHKSHYLILLRR